MQAVKSRIKRATSTRRGKIIVFSTLAVLFAAIGGGLWYWQANKESILRNKFESAVKEKSGGLYRVAYAHMQLDEIAGNLSVSNMILRYDSLSFEELKKGPSVPSILVSVTIPSLVVEGVRTKEALLDDEISGRKVHIKDPLIEIIYTNAGRDSTRTTPTREVYEQVLGNLDLISIDTVNITGARLVTRDYGSSRTYVEADDINLSLVGVQVDSAAGADSSRILFARQAAIACGRIRWSATSGRYDFALAGLTVNSGTGQLRLSKFDMTPRMGEAEFANSLAVQDDRHDISVDNIVVDGLDVPQLFEEEVLAESMTVGSASFRIYRDLNKPRDKKSRVGRYPHQVLDEIPLPFRINRLRIDNGFVAYKERTKITGRNATVAFHKISASISNFTNMKEEIERNNIMTVDINSRFMDLAPLRVKWTFYLLHPNGRFDLSGHLGSLDATKVNVLTVPMGPARIRKGTVNSLNFDLSGNDHALDGEVKFLYEDLRVTLLEKDDDDPGKLEKARTMTLLANIVIKNDNPRKGEPARTVNAHFDRDPNRSIFHLSWKTLFKGIRETVGIKK